MEKAQRLVELLKRLDAGEDPERVEEDAREFLAGVNPAELASAEQALIDSGVAPEELRRLCPAHLEVLGDKLGGMKARLRPGHMVHTLMREHEIISGYLDRLEEVNGAMQRMDSYSRDRDEFDELSHIAEHLVEAESHHQREEEVLFPELERRGVFGPPKVMRTEHVELRARKKALKELAEAADEMEFRTFKERLDAVVKSIVPALRDHIFKEDNILYPTALQVIGEARVWGRMKAKCDEMGYCCFTPGV